MQVKNIQLSDIIPSTMNPRKSFDQEALEELAQNIKENGLVQPITVRKAPKGANAKYEIVCGERRFRASQLIGATNIQAIVKELDDKQAFACMITENLQRKDIDPMDEAAAFNLLYTNHGCTIAEIAKMLGKSTSFVAGRIQLNNTIPEFVTLMHQGPLVLTHLLDICKLTKEQQEVLYTACFTEASRARWPYKFPNMPTLHEWIDEYVMNYLSTANFETSDSTLNNTCACDDCPLNTKNNPDSFKDVNKPRCMKRECFLAKSRESVFRTAKSMPEVQVVYEGVYTENEEIISAAEAYGLSVNAMGNRNYVICPTEPKKEDFSDMECYQRRLASYQNVKKVFDDNVSEGLVEKVFEICYDGKLSGEIKYTYFVPEENYESNSATHQAKDTTERISNFKKMIVESENKKKDNIVEKQRAFLETSEYSGLNTECSNMEMNVFYAIIAKRLSYDFKKSINLEWTPTPTNASFKKASIIIQENLNSVIREFIRVSLSEKSVNFSGDLADLLDKIMKERFDHVADQIEKDADALMQKTTANIRAKIDELRDTVLPTNKPKGENAEEENKLQEEQKSTETVDSSEEIVNSPSEENAKTVDSETEEVVSEETKAEDETAEQTEETASSEDATPEQTNETPEATTEEQTPVEEQTSAEEQAPTEEDE